METYKYVIIGGGPAGDRGAEGIRQVDAGGSIALVTAEPHAPYQRPPLSRDYLRGKNRLDQLYLREESYYTRSGIRVIKGVRANKIDPTARRVTLNDRQVLRYEKLLLATGGYAWRLPIAGNDLPGVFTLRTIEDANAIREAARTGKRALVIGGSFIGCEVASSLAQLGLEVLMVFPESRLLESIMPEELSAVLHARYEANGIHILAGHKPERLIGRDRIERAVVCGNDAHLFEIDLVVMGVGIRLNTDLARNAGLEMTKEGPVAVNEYLRTSDPNIYAVGDIAAWPDPPSDRRLQVEHWNVALQHGLRAGQNMAGEGNPCTALPHFSLHLFDLHFEVWGNLTAWDQTVLQGSLNEDCFAFYYFHGGRMVGALASGCPEEECKTMQRLVRERPSYEKVIGKATWKNITRQKHRQTPR